MKWIYGRQDWKTLERGLENCYLLTNGLGGFSSLTMIGAVARMIIRYSWHVRKLLITE